MEAQLTSNELFQVWHDSEKAASEKSAHSCLPENLGEVTKFCICDRALTEEEIQNFFSEPDTI